MTTVGISCLLYMAKVFCIFYMTECLLAGLTTIM